MIAQTPSCYLPKILKLVDPRRSYSVLHHCNFLRQSVYKATVRLLLRSGVLIEDRKSNRQTERHTDEPSDRRTAGRGINGASLASRGKNRKQERTLTTIKVVVAITDEANAVETGDN